MSNNHNHPAGQPAAATPETPVFPKEIHHPRPPIVPAGTPEKPAKRDNIFSKSRDVREDRDERQVKTSHNPQTLPHSH